MTEYNTVQEKLVLKEYGRNVQKLVKFLNTIEDREDRNKKSETLIELMKLINPNIKDTPEVAQKLWDDLHIISDFDIDVDGPFPKPDRAVLDKKPQKVEYTKNGIRFKHYGRNIELLIQRAIEVEDLEEKESAIVHIGKLMKTFFYSYNKDIIADEAVMSHITELSKGQLTIDMDKVKEFNLFEPQKKDRRVDNDMQRDNGNGNGNVRERSDRGDSRNRNKGGTKRNTNYKRRRN